MTEACGLSVSVISADGERLCEYEFEGVLVGESVGVPRDCDTDKDGIFDIDNDGSAVGEPETLDDGVTVLVGSLESERVSVGDGTSVADGDATFEGVKSSVLVAVGGGGRELVCVAVRVGVILDDAVGDSDAVCDADDVFVGVASLETDAVSTSESDETQVAEGVAINVCDREAFAEKVATSE